MPIAQKTIPLERLVTLAKYIPKTGEFVIPCGKVTKGGKSKRNLVIWLEGKRYPCHRVAWALMTGEWPEDVIDHKDGDWTNNKWDNLRAATQGQNIANSRKPKTNTSGFKGVTKATKNRWRAKIRHQGKNIHLGLFPRKKDAHAAYVNASIELNREFARAS